MSLSQFALRVLAAFGYGNRFVDVMMRFVKMFYDARLQPLGMRIVFFLAAIGDGLVQQIAGLVQTSLPRPVWVHRRVIRYIFPVVDGGALNFPDRFVNLVDGVAFLMLKRSAVGTFQETSGVPQIGKRPQIVGMFSLSKKFLRHRGQQECQCNCDERNFH